MSQSDNLEPCSDYRSNATRAPVISADPATLIWPHTSTQFRDEYWQKQIVFTEGGAHRLAKLLSACSFDVAQLLEQALEPVTVWLSGRDKDLKTKTVDRLRALEEYRSGASLYIETQGTALPFAKYADPLGSVLGIPPGFGHSNVIAVSNAFYTPIHFDPNENFTIQLVGSKRWRIWTPNGRGTAPLHNCIEGRPISEELRLYAGDPRGTLRRAPDFDVTLKPGSILYLPRGFWHSVESASTSLSLNVAFPAHSWLDALLPLIRRRLLRYQKWRESAYGMLPHATSGQEVFSRAEELIGELSQDLCDLKAASFASNGITETPACIFRRNPIASFHSRSADKGRFVEVWITPFGTDWKLFSPTEVAFLEWILMQEVFDTNLIVSCFGATDSEKLKRVLTFAILEHLIFPIAESQSQCSGVSDAIASDRLY